MNLKTVLLALGPVVPVSVFATDYYVMSNYPDCLWAD